MSSRMITLSRPMLADQLAHLVLLVGVEAVGGLVEDQHFRVVENRLGEADAALEAFGKCLDGLIDHRTQAHELDCTIHAL